MDKLVHLSTTLNGMRFYCNHINRYRFGKQIVNHSPEHCWRVCYKQKNKIHVLRNIYLKYPQADNFIGSFDNKFAPAAALLLQMKLHKFCLSNRARPRSASI